MHYDFLALDSGILPISARYALNEMPANLFYYYGGDKGSFQALKWRGTLAMSER